MAGHLIFGVLYLILAIVAFVLSKHERRAGKDYRLLQLWAFVALTLAGLKMWHIWAH
jgi:hypothetical protein